MYKYDTKRSFDYNNEIRRYLPGGVHSNFIQNQMEIPLVITSAKNSRVKDIDGNEYLDLHSHYGAMILGHGHEGYTESMRRAILNPCAVGFSETVYDVCALLNKHVPSAEMVRFGLSGTEMISNSFRLARAYTAKRKIVRFANHYHGSADNTLGGTCHETSSSANYYSAIFDTKGRAEGVLQNEMIILPWNNIEALEETISKQYHEIAAIVMELITMNGDGTRADKEYLRQVRGLCFKYRILLIFDEMITGVRLGLGGAQSMYGVTPDLTVYGKAISNGYMPVTVLMGKKNIMKLYESGEVVHGGTYNGYPLGMAAVLTTLNILENTDVYKTLSDIGNGLASIIIEEAEKAGLTITARGDGACPLLCVHLNPTDEYNYFGEIEYYANGLLKTCLALNGVFIAPVCRIFPNLSISVEDMEFFRERSRNAVRDMMVILLRRKLIKLNR